MSVAENFRLSKTAHEAHLALLVAGWLQHEDADRRLGRAVRKVRDEPVGMSGVPAQQTRLSCRLPDGLGICASYSPLGLWRLREEGPFIRDRGACAGPMERMVRGGLEAEAWRAAAEPERARARVE